MQVRLGDTVTFLPTPLRNWWGRPRLQQAWLGLSIYVIIVMVRLLAFKRGIVCLQGVAAAASVEEVA